MLVERCMSKAAYLSAEFPADAASDVNVVVWPDVPNIMQDIIS